MLVNYKFYQLVVLSSVLLVISKLQAEMPPPPPKEAIAACSALSEGEQCSFTHPQGTLEGFCFTIAQQLACAPEGGPGSVATPPDNGETRPPLGANFDPTTAILSLPVVSVDDEQFFQVSLQLVSTTPVLLNLTEVITIDQVNQVAATYDSSTENLVIPQLNFDAKQYHVDLQLVAVEPHYQFKLISMSEMN